MPEQRSALTISAIRSLLRIHYGLSVSKVSPLGHGSANCFCVSDHGTMYFLKEYQSRFTEADLKHETDLVDYLIKQQYPTAAIIPTLHGGRYIRHQDRYILLQNYICGRTYIEQPLPHHLLMESAGWLGRLHSILQHYVLPCEMDMDWLRTSCPDKLYAGYDDLLAALETQKEDSLYERIKSDILYKKHLLHRLSALDIHYDGITYRATHGDLSCFQYICDDDHILAIIDFSSARTLPVVWEIMRSYVQSAHACKNGIPFDSGDFCQYIHRYLEYAPLTEKDLAAMPYVYLSQLSRSMYGYREYLLTKTENRDDLIQFALWRTDICREIFQKREEIAARSLSLL
ncbi:MAG: phosphotransferase [Lachnospiraceae bacterium]|nr:phosphotransferase [Lachnospiraceae bacterium]